MKDTLQNHNDSASNLTLQVLSNIAAKYGYERTTMRTANKSGSSAPVSHLRSEEENLLLRAIGAEHKTGGTAQQAAPNRPRTGNSGAIMSLDELARKKY